jgi:hypothetical protein
MRVVVGCLVGVLTLACGPGRLIRESNDTNDGSSPNGSSGAPSSSSGDSSSGGSSSGGSSSGGSSSGGSSSSGGDDDTPTGDGGTDDPGTTTTDTDTGGAFIAEPDGGIVGQCDPMLQDCRESEKCTAYSTEPGYCCVDANKCVPIIGDKKRDEPCTRLEDNDDCDKGFFCLPETTSGDTGPGTCWQFCSDELPDLCPDGFFCPLYGDGTLPLCYQECNPLLQDCPESTDCYDEQGVFVCRPWHGDADDGDECHWSPECLPGLVCVHKNSTSDCEANYRCCTPICDLAATDPDAPCDVAGGEACYTYWQYGPPPAGFENVGHCILPP